MLWHLSTKQAHMNRINPLERACKKQGAIKRFSWFAENQMSPIKSLNVIGCGRVGTTLDALLQRHSVREVPDLYSTASTAEAKAV